MTKKKKISMFVTIGLCAALLLGCGTSTSEPEKVGEVDDNTEKVVEETSEDEAVVEETPEYAVGDIVETEDLRISFLSAGEYVSDNEFLQPEDGSIYYRVEFEFENLGEDDAVVTEFDFNAYADGYSVDSTWLLDDVISATLSSGKKAKGAIYYEIPAETETMELEYTVNMFTEEKIIFIAK